LNRLQLNKNWNPARKAIKSPSKIPTQPQENWFLMSFHVRLIMIERKNTFKPLGKIIR
jgi:hypothetical protein